MASADFRGHGGGGVVVGVDDFHRGCGSGIELASQKSRSFKTSRERRCVRPRLHVQLLTPDVLTCSPFHNWIDADALVNHFLQRPLDQHAQGLLGGGAAFAGAGQAAIDQQCP